MCSSAAQPQTKAVRPQGQATRPTGVNVVPAAGGSPPKKEKTQNRNFESSSFIYGALGRGQLLLESLAVLLWGTILAFAEKRNKIRGGFKA